jgi:anti-sigma factor ChrR (cupin superfamily)
MTPERINADFSLRAVMRSDDMPWAPSPQAGVERRFLDRIGGEVARATSIVRYAPGCDFPPHRHDLGEEFLVLDGVFSDEHGDYPAGTYVRNPPGSRHAPRTDPGCVIFVKLRQMRADEARRIVVLTDPLAWTEGDVPHLARKLLHVGRSGETVALERLAPASRLAPGSSPAGEEVLVLDGDLMAGDEVFEPGTWIRNPPGFQSALSTQGGVTYFVKRGHLPPEI